MISTEIPNFLIKYFNKSIEHFGIFDLSDLLVKYPELEFPHKQDFYSIYFIEDAKGEMIIDNFRIRLDNPKVIINKSHCISKISINRKAKGKIICFTEDFFSLRYNNNILKQFSFIKMNSVPYIRLSSENNEKLQILLRLITEEFHLNKKDSKKVLRSYLNIILFELDRLYHPIEVINNNKSIKLEKIQEFEKLVDKHFDTKKHPHEYAELLHISSNYLNKICKEVIGITAGEMIRKRIILESERLLNYTNYSINEIAYKLGFENASYFITFFKKQTGVTPKQFRKNIS